LRKDFIIDAYQVEETKAMGADIILLIAACLTPAEVKKLAALAHGLGMEILLEIHNREELNHICEDVDYVGVNNRDLKTFTVDVQRSVELSNEIPHEFIKIAESGIHQASTIQMLRRYGYLGFLIGENFMKEPDPAIAFASFVNELKKEPYEGKSLRHDATGPGQKAG
jgi:indole-3-glycerol phosphate synthase